MNKAIAAAVCMLACAAACAAPGAEEGVGMILERPGGLLPCEDVPGDAATLRRPAPMVLPRADGGATALFFCGHATHSRLPMEVVFVDLETGQSRVEEFQGLGNPWSQTWGPDGRLYFGLWGPATLLRYDPATDKVDRFGVIEPSERSVPLLTVGTDDKVYALTSSQGHVFSIDPATDEIVHYGRQGPKREFGIAYSGSIAVDDEFIYSAFGNIPAETRTLAMNKKTREVIELNEIKGAGFSQGRMGVTAASGGRQYWMYQGKAILKKRADEKPPWPDRPLAERKARPAFRGKPEVLANATSAERDGTTTIWYRPDDKSEWKSAAFKIHAEPVVLSRCATLPDGRVFASTVGYEGLYAYDPKGDTFAHVGHAPISHYTTAILDGKVYLANYPGGCGLFVWDPARPWTIGTTTPTKPEPPDTTPESNPRRAEPWAREGNFQFPMFLVQGADKALYAALHGERHNVGGVLSWRELDTGKKGFLREPFELHDVAGMCTALAGAKIVYSSRTVKGIKGEPKPATARIFVVDVATRTMEWYIEPFEGVDNTGMVVEGKPGELVLAMHRRPGGKAGSTLYKVDMAKRQVVQKLEFPGVLANPREYFWHIDFMKGPDGMIYTLYDDTLVRIHPETLAVTALSKVGPTGHITFVGKDVYMTGLSHFRRVRNVLGG